METLIFFGLIILILFLILKTNNSFNKLLVFSCFAIILTTSHLSNAQYQISENSKYAPILEHFLQIYYKGWIYDKAYIPNSLKDITVLTKDTKGNPTKIRGVCSFTLSGITGGWIDVLLNDGIVYGVIFFNYPHHVLTPLQNVDKRLFTTSELAKMNYLQNIYLYNKIILEIQKKWGSDASQPMDCLKKEKLEEIKGIYKSVQVGRTVYSTGPVPEFQDVLVDTEKITRTAYKNVCGNNITIKGIEKIRDTYALSYRDASFTLRPNGDTHYLIGFGDSKDIITLSDNSTIYFFDNPSNYIFKNDIQSQNDIAKIKNNSIQIFDKITNNTNNINTSSNIKSVIAKRLNDNSIEINSETNTSDITVKKGTKVNVIATGLIKLGTFAGSGSANGIIGYDDYSKIKGFRHGSLLGKIGNGDWFLIGENKSFIPDRDGILSFMVNDRDPSNNSGSFIVEYAINKTLTTVPTNPAVTTPTRRQSNEQTYTQSEPEKTNEIGFTNEELQQALKKYSNKNVQSSIIVDKTNPELIKIESAIKYYEEMALLNFKLAHPLISKSSKYRVGSKKYEEAIAEERAVKLKYENTRIEEKKIISETSMKNVQKS